MKEKERRIVFKKTLRALNHGKIISFHTDTVMGLGCDAFHVGALEDLYTLKKRSPFKPIIWFIYDISQLESYLHIPPLGKKLMDMYWPGALTLVLDCKKEEKTQAVRMPNSQALLDFLKYYRKILASTSANISGQKEIASFKEIEEVFHKEVYLFEIEDKNSLSSNLPSTIVAINQNNSYKVLREGEISLDLRKI